jgi:hypothetical protein
MFPRRNSAGAHEAKTEIKEIEENRREVGEEITRENEMSLDYD